MNKVVSIDEIKKEFKDGMTLMIGGFLGVGTPEKIIDILVDMNIKDLTIIANDTSFIDRGIGRLVANGQCKKVIASHIGTNKETGKRMVEKTMDVELSPQGTLAERIRAGGCGLGGILTKTGLGTIVAENKDIIEIDGEKYLLEKPLRADVALIGGNISDEFGNTIYKGTTRNFNPLMAMAAKKVIVGAKQIVKTGEIDPNNVVTPGVLVDYIVKDGE
ncbi:3-oxoacid CoA-transferase subunit A [Peptostreptococcaceae bacterium AGR-M142]